MSAPDKESPGGEAEQGAGADLQAELAALFSDAPLAVRDPDSGETVALRVREFRFEEGLEALAAARPIILALAALAPADAEPGAAPPDLFDFDTVAAAHPAEWFDLLSRACGRPAAWIARLPYSDARRLGLSMWAANGPFFVEPALDVAKARRQQAAPSRSSASSIPSSAPATGAGIAT